MKRSLLIAALAVFAFASLGGVAVADHDENPFVQAFNIGNPSDRAEGSELAFRFIVLDESNQPVEDPDGEGPTAIFLVEQECDRSLDFAAVFVGDQAAGSSEPATIGSGGSIDECEGEDEVTVGFVESHTGDPFQADEDLFVEGTDFAFTEESGEAELFDIGQGEGPMEQGSPGDGSQAQGDNEVLEPFNEETAGDCEPGPFPFCAPSTE